MLEPGSQEEHLLRFVADVGHPPGIDGRAKDPKLQLPASFFPTWLLNTHLPVSTFIVWKNTGLI